MSGAGEVVSAVIPTRNRPAFVGRAVRSALNQTLQSVEVIVVVDGPDERTVYALAQISDSHLRIISLKESVGAQEALNVGVRESHGLLVAFLGDDDEWLPTKVERQLRVAQTSRWSHPHVSGGLIA